MKKSPATVLMDAVEVLRRNSHYKGGFYRRDSATPVQECPVCALGAILIAVEGVPQVPESGIWPEEAFEAAKVLSRSIYSPVVDSDPVERIAEWNDQLDRTPDEVMQAMTIAAEEWAA